MFRPGATNRGRAGMLRYDYVLLWAETLGQTGAAIPVEPRIPAVTRAVVVRSIQQNFFFGKQTLRHNSSFTARLDQSIRRNDRIGTRRVFDAHDVVEPGFLS